jgi:hypothetical protein
MAYPAVSVCRTMKSVFRLGCATLCLAINVPSALAQRAASSLDSGVQVSRYQRLVNCASHAGVLVASLSAHVVKRELPDSRAWQNAVAEVQVLDAIYKKYIRMAAELNPEGMLGMVHDMTETAKPLQASLSLFNKANWPNPDLDDSWATVVNLEYARPVVIAKAYEQSAAVRQGCK